MANWQCVMLCMHSLVSHFSVLKGTPIYEA